MTPNQSNSMAAIAYLMAASILFWLWCVILLVWRIHHA